MRFRLLLIHLSSVGILVMAATLNAAIPQSERDALIALYNATDGDNWTVNTGWLGSTGSECTWYGVNCIGDHVTAVYLYSNNLTGSIPPELGNLSGLQWLLLNTNQLSGNIPPELGNLGNVLQLALDSNQLSGNIPPELGNLGNVLQLALDSNQLSGNIPPELGNPGNLWDLNLGSNQLSGSIPPQLGNLSNLQTLHLGFNQLSGNIPPELGNLGNLHDLYLRHNQLSGSISSEIGDLNSDLWLRSNNLVGQIPTSFGSRLRAVRIDWNGLWTDDEALIAYLNDYATGWELTQTIAPSDLTVASVWDHTAWLEWTPIIYTGDTGSYEVFNEPVIGRMPTSGGFTSSKSDATFPVTHLQPGQPYDFKVRTFTNPHVNNQNIVVSGFSSPVMATTSSSGCIAPLVTITTGGGFTLTVTTTHNTYEWSTGETTASILVNPSTPTWYWVRTTGPGSCDEATVVYVRPAAIFADGFENGNTSAWSVTVPQGRILSARQDGVQGAVADG